ncbi:MAG: DNA polymerase III subunit epsilon [Candidatus Binatia bacterium]|nr:MAG: DNA polymerase III subunit epsilon [Candidatus Binatia bacterium]
MRDKIVGYLRERPAGATVEELLDLIFTHPGSDGEIGPYFVRLLLEPDPRFVWDAARGRWKLREFQDLARTLDEATFVVVDIETTGLTPEPGGIMEIGAARIESGRVVAHFERLVRPSKRPPPFIVRLTGITWELLRDQPPISEVWREFSDFIRDAVLVAHNASFDFGYLNLASRALSGVPLADTYLCTLKLARRLVPESRKRGLDALAELFGIRTDRRHRALGDALITTEVLFHLIERAKRRGLRYVDELLALQHEGRDGRPFFCPLPRAVVEELPDSPGIYRFYDENDRLLYVGRARDLRRRVASYLSNSESHSNKTLDLIRHIHRVRVERCSSELEAALREAEEIRATKPPYNQRAKHLPQVAYLKLGREQPFPRISITSRPRRSGELFIGPLRSRHEAERLLKIWSKLYGLRTCRGALNPSPDQTPCFQGQTGLCSMPCAARITASEYQDRVAAFLEDLQSGGAHTRQFLESERERLAGLERFEAAQRLQDDLVFFDGVCARFQFLGWLNREQNFLLLVPQLCGGAVDAYLLLSGELVARTAIYRADELTAWLQRVRHEPTQKLGRAQRVDSTVILVAWLRDRKASAGILFRVPDPKTSWPATLVGEWRAACDQLLAAPSLEPLA